MLSYIKKKEKKQEKTTENDMIRNVVKISNEYY